MAKNDSVVNHNKSYKECKMDVETHMRKVKGGGEELSHYIGEVGKVIKTVAIEPKRAKQLNRTWHTRRVMYLDADAPLPEKVKRTENDEENGDEWKDELIGAKA
jgi:hypothetical protein